MGRPQRVFLQGVCSGVLFLHSCKRQLLLLQLHGRDLVLLLLPECQAPLLLGGQLVRCSCGGDWLLTRLLVLTLLSLQSEVPLLLSKHYCARVSLLLLLLLQAQGCRVVRVEAWTRWGGLRHEGDCTGDCLPSVRGDEGSQYSGKGGICIHASDAVPGDWTGLDC